MRLSRPGWLALAGGAALVISGRVLGLVELYAVGAAIGVLLVLCALWVSLRGIDLVVARAIRPHRIHAGNPCTVEIQIRNRTTRRTPILQLRDGVTGTAGASLLLAPLNGLRTTTVAYRLPTTHRGLITIGPLTSEITDPFGLVTTTITAAPAIDITILPRFEEINPLPRTAGPDPDGAADHASSMGRAGEDFVALRPYVVGDDLRKVHWASSARASDDLLVRQDDVPWQGRVCVVLDNRREIHDVDTLERAVTATASIVRTHIRRGDHVRLALTSGSDFGEHSGPTHLQLMLEHLAIVGRTAHGSLRNTLSVVGRGGAGALVLVSGRPPESDVDALESLGASFPVRRMVRFDQSLRVTRGRGTGVLGFAPHEEFGAVWNQAAVGRSRRRARMLE